MNDFSISDKILYALCDFLISFLLVFSDFFSLLYWLLQKISKRKNNWYLVGPKHWNCPLTMIPKRPHNSSHSSILWEVKIIDCPFFWTFLIIFHNFRLEAGSTPELGSSMKIIGGSATRAWATFSFRLFPPLKREKWV